MEQPKAPGLKLRPRKTGHAAYWVASPEAIAVGYLPKSVRLHYESESDCAARCQVLQAQMLLWLQGHRGERIIFDGSFATLIDRYQSDSESSYQRLKPSAKHPYEIYARKLKGHIGPRLIACCDGRDVQRWFKAWAGVDDLKHPDARLPRARAALAVLKATVSFGVICRLPGCAEFSAILSELEFPAKKRRAFAPTAAMIEAARSAAHAANAPHRALAYAIQYDTTLRQWDVIGVWVPLSDHRPSTIIKDDRKWIGPTWAMVDDSMVLRLTYGKTEDTSGTSGAYDLKACPMVMEELAKGAAERSGPLIINEKTGLPYEYDHFKAGWKGDFKAAGLDRRMWNRDLRAGAITEGARYGADRTDLSKVAGHTTTRMVATVYDRDTVEAHRRTAAVRKAGRQNDDGTG